jgi:hypothetical protein
MTRETNPSLSTWPFPPPGAPTEPPPVSEPGPPVEPQREPVDPVEQELVDEQLERDRQASRKASPSTG